MKRHTFQSTLNIQATCSDVSCPKGSHLNSGGGWAVCNWINKFGVKRWSYFRMYNIPRLHSNSHGDDNIVKWLTASGRTHKARVTASYPTWFIHLPCAASPDQNDSKDLTSLCFYRYSLKIKLAARSVCLKVKLSDSPHPSRSKCEQEV